MLNVNSKCFQPKQTFPYVVSLENEREEFVDHVRGAALVYCQNNRGEVFPLKMLLDSSGMSNLITQDVALALGLSCERVNTSICCINGLLKL
ncbi:hypothetical protein TNCT_428001 [Trichonephila clavata]|uniref:Uncharacterized protein n=1 Tax=Trichonephila clavata TaxID=2740835 RepID=A0A8X6LCM3_TRICU|nr:hypothetical protein TNCT_428001 [Trichonephila clavata]